MNTGLLRRIDRGVPFPPRAGVEKYANAHLAAEGRSPVQWRLAFRHGVGISVEVCAPGVVATFGFAPPATRTRNVSSSID